MENETRKIEEVAWDVIFTFNENVDAPQIIDGKIMFYLTGSLTTLALLCADKIEDITLDENAAIVSIDNPREIDDETRRIFKGFRRQINDVDYVQVNGIISTPYKKIDAIKDIDILHSGGPSSIRTTDPRDSLCGHNLCQLTHNGRKIIIPSPIDIVSYKISQCTRENRCIVEASQHDPNEIIPWSKSQRTYGKKFNTFSEKYAKGIKDIYPILAGVFRLYPIDKIGTRLKQILISEDAFDPELLELVAADLGNVPGARELFDYLNEKTL